VLHGCDEPVCDVESVVCPQSNKSTEVIEEKKSELSGTHCTDTNDKVNSDINSAGLHCTPNTSEISVNSTVGGPIVSAASVSAATAGTTDTMSVGSS